MRKVNKYIYIIFVFVLFSICTNVHASMLPYGWKAGGIVVTRDGDKIRMDNDGKVVKLFLNNYKGDSLAVSFGGNATAQDDLIFNIYLEGDNYINSDIVGIDFWYSDELNFYGNGTLTINAPIPIMYKKDYYDNSRSNTLYIKPSENIMQLTNNSSQNNNSEVKKEETTNKEENKDSDAAKVENDSEKKDESKKENIVADKSGTTNKEVKSDNGKQQLVLYVLVGVIAVLAVVIVCLVVKISKFNKNIKTKVEEKKEDEEVEENV